MAIQIIRCKNHDAVGKLTANLIANTINSKPNLVLGLPTGQTPIPVYQELRKMYSKGNLDCSKVTTFNLDEYFRRGKGDPDSYYTFMHEQLFDHIPFKASYLPNAKPENSETIPTSQLIPILQNACYEYDKKIDAEGGIDIQLVGLGSNGHIGFNEPSPEEISDGTCIVTLAGQTISDNANKFYGGDESKVPKKAISMGMGKIMQAKSIILIANGGSKATAIYDSLRGPITPMVPASLLRLHPDVTFIIDEAAAKLLD